MGKILPYIRLMRPANLLTAVADIMFGFAASGMAINFLYDQEGFFDIPEIRALYLLMISTVCLYAGGVVFNDVFDYATDKTERPERPLPSGQASRTGAIVLGVVLLASGIFSAGVVSLRSGCIALLIAVLALLYNGYSKKHPVTGPVNMGACRSANLLLGMSISEAALIKLWFLALIPIVYIGAITLISRGEVHGASRKTIENGMLLYGTMLIGILHLGFLDEFSFWQAVPFILLFVAATLPSWINALKSGDPMDIRKAVKTGVLALILLDASLAAGFAGFEFGILVLALLPVSLFIAKRFSVT